MAQANVRHPARPQAPDAVQRRLIGIDRIVALTILLYVSVYATSLASLVHLLSIGILTAVFVGVVFYADYRYQSGRR